MVISSATDMFHCIRTGFTLLVRNNILYLSGRDYQYPPSSYTCNRSYYPDRAVRVSQWRGSQHQQYNTGPAETHTYCTRHTQYFMMALSGVMNRFCAGKPFSPS